jgi:very-short-patch-repair endonuclease
MIIMKWYIDQHKIKTVPPSEAESKIIDILRNKKVIYHREVVFENCVSKKRFPLLFDFWIPDRNLVIEYDGKHHLTDAEIIINDDIKNKYCLRNKIRLIRLNKKNWFTLEKDISKILSQNIIINSKENLKAEEYKDGYVRYPKSKKKNNNKSTISPVIKKKKRKLSRKQKALKKIPVTIEDYNRFMGNNK